MTQKRNFERITDTIGRQETFWVENGANETPKSGKNRSNFEMTRSIIFEKNEIFSFSFIKNDF